MFVDSRSLWLAQTNCYVVASEPGSMAVVIDAPPDPVGVARLAADHDLTLVALLVTHGHIDHVGGAGAVARQAGITTYVHPADDFLTLDPHRQMEMLLGTIPAGDFAPPDRREPLKAEQRLELAGITFDVLFTPGHTPGHCCFLVEDEGLLFSGDQLFAGSIGRTDLPGGDFNTLLASMEDEILTLDDDVNVLPGHGPPTTVGRERRTNPFLQDLK